MRFLRAAFIVLAVGAGLLLAAAAVAFNADFQTWGIRRELAHQREVRSFVGRVAIGWGTTEIRDLHLERNGAVLTLPALHADLPLLAEALGHRVLVRGLVAKGWTLDLSGTAAATAYLGPGGLMTAAVFEGVFDELHLPVDLSLDGVDLEGEIILPQAPGQAPLRLQVSLTGGGLAAGQQGRFTFAARAAAPTGLPVGSLALDGVATAAMATPRTFSRLALRVTAAATGPKLGAGVKLAADLGAVRQSGGENYTATLTSDSKQLAAVVASFPADTRRLNGTWKVDLSDDDLSPFALGRVLPVFAAAGAGHFDTDAAGQDVHVSGSLNAVLDRLAAGHSPLTEQGSLRLASDFDVTRRRSLLRVDRLAATVSRAGPILELHSLQAFAFDVTSGQLQVADAKRDLLGLSLHALPLAWLQPWTAGLDLAGEPLRGEFVASARGGGLSLNTTSPLRVDGLSLGRKGRILCRDAELALSVAADYTPQGWQLEVASGALRHAGESLLDFEAKIGRLAGAGEPIKWAGHVVANLPALLAQPAFDDWAVSAGDPGTPAATRRESPLTDGICSGDFSGSVGFPTVIQAKGSLTHLVANRRITTEALPAVSAELRADLEADAKVSFSVPLVITQEDRRSDLTLTGTVGLGLLGFKVEGEIASNRLVLDDVRLLGAPFAAGPASGVAGGTALAGPAGPVWGPAAGKFNLALKRVEFGRFIVTDAAGLLDASSRGLAVSGARAHFADGGSIALSGSLDFSPSEALPYALNTGFTATDFNPAGLLRRANANAPPALEGKFTLQGQFGGRGLSPGEALAGLQGSCQVTSKGGIFRGLATEISPPAASSGRAAVIGALLGDVASAVSDVLSRRKGGNFGNIAQAVMAAAKDLSTVSYDQLSLTLSRDADLDTAFQEIALIAPELRLRGSGKVTARPGVAFLDQPLELALTLDARGRLAEALKFTGVLDLKPDDLGYTPSILPLHVTGTLREPDTSELQADFLKLAFDRSGAAALVNQWLGK
jgi:hypothetical protein